MGGWNEGQAWQLYDLRGVRKYLTPNEAVRFLNMTRHLPVWRRACLYVLAYTGCRLSEACNLTIDQLDVEESALTFRTLKRRKLHLRRVLVPQWLTDMLRQLPVTRDGRFWPVVRQTVWRWVKKAMANAEIEGPMACPKGLRHGFIVCGGMLKVPETTLQKWAGHSSVTTTGIYLDACGDEERELASRIWCAFEGAVLPAPAVVAPPAVTPIGIPLPPTIAATLQDLHDHIHAEEIAARQRSVTIARLIARVEAALTA